MKCCLLPGHIASLIKIGVVVGIKDERMILGEQLLPWALC